MTADVTSGHGSLANIIAKEFMRDEAPKAPILLYAIETRNPYSRKTQSVKHDLTELNRSLWLGELLPSFDMVIPFDVGHSNTAFTKSPLFEKTMSGYRGSNLIYHRSALQAVVAQAVTDRLMPGGLNEDFRDINGRKHTDMADLINTVLYTQKPNIATPALQLPLLNLQGQRFAENLQAKQLLDESQFLYFNRTDQLKKEPLRHSFFFSGMDTLRDVNSEDASPFADHVQKLIL